MKHQIPNMSLALAEQLPAQTVFNHVVKQMLTQNERCSTEYTCLYRQGDKVCAAGAVISDAELKQAADAYVADHTLARIGDTPADTLASVGVHRIYRYLGVDQPVHYELMNSLQCIHDDVDPEGWRDVFHHLAKRLNLDWVFDHE